MRRLAILIAWMFAFVLVQPPQLGAQYVQYGYNKGGGGGGGTAPTEVSFSNTTGFTNLDYTPGAGHSVLLVYSIGTGSDVSSITDSNNTCASTWVHVASAQSTNSLNEFWGAWRCSSVNANNGHQTLGGATSVKENATVEINGSSAYDATSCTTSGTTSMPGVATSGADLLIAAVASSSGSVTFTAPTTSLGSGSAFNFEYFGQQSQNTSGTYGVSTSASVQGCIFAVKQ